MNDPTLEEDVKLLACDMAMAFEQESVDKDLLKPFPFIISTLQGMLLNMQGRVPPGHTGYLRYLNEYAFFIGTELGARYEAVAWRYHKIRTSGLKW